MNQNELIDWLLQKDVSIQFQTHRDLLGISRNDLRDRIAVEGWGKAFLAVQNPNGHWGQSFYQPKWISTHYTLLDLRNLNISPQQEDIKRTIQMVLDTHKAEDGGIRLGPSTTAHSDVCVNAMFLNYASYFQSAVKDLHSLVDSLLNEIMPDGGFNCRTTRSGAVHSSLHTTISVLEGLTGFTKAGYMYRSVDIESAIESSQEFILLHKLFLSDHSGKIIHKDFLKFRYPCRWKYDILRALDYFQYSGRTWDERMRPALDVLLSKRNKDATWNVQAKHPGQVHIEMESAGSPSGWNTLRALRILKHFEMQ